MTAVNAIRHIYLTRICNGLLPLRDDLVLRHDGGTQPAGHLEQMRNGIIA